MALKQLSIITSIYERDAHEYIIADYITKNIYDISKLNASDLIYLTGVSRTSFYRFLKKLGYTSFVSLQQDLLDDIKSFKNYSHKQINNYSFSHLLKDKKRVIVLGDTNFIASLLPYKQLYLNKGIELCLSINEYSSYDHIKQYDLNENDIVFYISLFQSNYDLLKDLEGKYMNTVRYLKEQHVPYVYVGKTVISKDYEKYFIKINESSFNQCIHQLCIIFEDMLVYF